MSMSATEQALQAALTENQKLRERVLDLESTNKRVPLDFLRFFMRMSVYGANELADIRPLRVAHAANECLRPLVGGTPERYSPVSNDGPEGDVKMRAVRKMVYGVERVTAADVLKWSAAAKYDLNQR